MRRISMLAFLLLSLSLIAQDKPSEPAPAAKAKTTTKKQDGHAAHSKTADAKSTGKSVTDPTLSSAANAAMAAVDPEKIRAHVKYLSDDKLEGRGTGQKGGHVAADYIARQFASYGLKPAGDKGTYLQKVPLVGLTTLPVSIFTITTKEGDLSLRLKDDYVANNETLTQSADIDAPIVWVGYGIEAPEYKWDDYKGVDVRGKFLLMLVNEPPSTDDNFFKGKALTYYGRWTYKFEEAGRKGAVGVMLIHQTDMASYGWEVVRNSNTGEKSYLRDKAPHVRSAGWITGEVATKLAAANGMDLEQMLKDAQSRDFHPKELDSHVKATLIAKIRDLDTTNVVGILPGSDPKLKDEAISYSAHYDHLGIHADEPGDNIYNGAADNATGCGILMEIARVMSVAKSRPKRSVIFAAVTAEEQGLLGSQYLGQQPPFPAKKISLALNYDDLPPIGDPEEVEVSGAERTNFFPTVQAEAKTFGMEIKPDSRPEAGHYYRSDHFSFARVGIPSFSVNEGMKYAGHTLHWGMDEAKDYTEHRYHQPSDQYKDDMYFSGDALMARFGIALGWHAADQPAEVQWQQGDEFEKARKQ